MKRVKDEELDYSDDDICLYDGEPFTGLAYEEDSGILIAETEYKDGGRNGLSRFWYSSGKLSMEERFLGDVRHGLCEEWFENGNIKRSANYEFGIVLRENEWDEKGSVLREYILKPSDPGYDILIMRREASHS